MELDKCVTAHDIAHWLLQNSEYYEAQEEDRFELALEEAEEIMAERSKDV